MIVDEIEKTFTHIKEHGLTTMIVEKNALRALDPADRAVIMDTAQIALDNTAREVLDNEEMRNEYPAI